MAQVKVVSTNLKSGTAEVVLHTEGFGGKRTSVTKHLIFDSQQKEWRDGKYIGDGKYVPGNVVNVPGGTKVAS